MTMLDLTAEQVDSIIIYNLKDQIDYLNTTTDDIYHDKSLHQEKLESFLSVLEDYLTPDEWATFYGGLR